MVRMPPLPVRKYYHSRPLLAQHAHNLQPVFPGVLHPPVGNVERLPPRHAQDFRCLRCLAGAIFRAAPRAHLSPGEIENSGAISALRHLQQSAAAGLLYVVTVGGKGKNIEWRGGHQSRFPCSSTTFSRMITRWRISFKWAMNRQP